MISLHRRYWLQHGKTIYSVNFKGKKNSKSIDLSEEDLSRELAQAVSLILERPYRLLTRYTKHLKIEPTLETWSRQDKILATIHFLPRRDLHPFDMGFVLKISWRENRSKRNSTAYGPEVLLTLNKILESVVEACEQEEIENCACGSKCGGDCAGEDDSDDSSMNRSCNDPYETGSFSIGLDEGQLSLSEDELSYDGDTSSLSIDTDINRNKELGSFSNSLLNPKVHCGHYSVNNEQCPFLTQDSMFVKGRDVLGDTTNILRENLKMASANYMLEDCLFKGQYCINTEKLKENFSIFYEQDKGIGNLKNSCKVESCKELLSSLCKSLQTANETNGADYESDRKKVCPSMCLSVNSASLEESSEIEGSGLGKLEQALDVAKPETSGTSQLLEEQTLESRRPNVEKSGRTLRQRKSGISYQECRKVAESPAKKRPNTSSVSASSPKRFNKGSSVYFQLDEDEEFDAKLYVYNNLCSLDSSSLDDLHCLYEDDLEFLNDLHQDLNNYPVVVLNKLSAETIKKYTRISRGEKPDTKSRVKRSKYNWYHKKKGSISKSKSHNSSHKNEKSGNRHKSQNTSNGTKNNPKRIQNHAHVKISSKAR